MTSLAGTSFASKIVALAPGITPSAVLSRTTGIAPLYVHFDMTGTTSTQTARPFLDVRYRVNFGDGSAGSWTNGASLGSKNIAEGPLAGHVYETAGTFEPYVDYWDGASTTRLYTDTVTVTAADAATEFLTTKTVVVNNVGDADFTGAPAGATQVNTDSLQTAMASLTGTVKCILFKRGGSWATTAAINKNLAGPLLIGAYGTGAKPVWLLDSAFTGYLGGIYVMSLGGAALLAGRGDLRVMDIDIDGTAVTGSKIIWGFSNLGTYDQQTFLRVTFRSFTLGINNSEALLTINEATQPGQRVYDQLAIVDCEHLSPPLISQPYFYYTIAERFFIAGAVGDMEATTVQATGSHCIRIPYGYKGIISSCTLANPGNGRHHVKLHGPTWRESAEGVGDWEPVYSDDQHRLNSTGIPQVQTSQGGGAGTTRYIVMTDNKFSQGVSNGCGWQVGISPQDGNGGSMYPAELFHPTRVRDVLCERNWHIASTAYLAAYEITATDVTLRNNIVNLTGANIHTFALVWRRLTENPCDDIFIFNNSASHTDGASGEPLCDVRALVTGVVYKNNLYYAANDTTGTMLLDVGTGTISSNNTTNIQTDPTFAGALTALAGWAASGASVVGQGASVPVWGDLFGNLRATGSRDIGAGEQ